MKSQKNPAVLRGPLDTILFTAFVVLWLVPITYSGVAYQPLRILPDYLRYLDRVSCLFHTSTKYWSNFYVQVQLAGSDVWLTPPESEFSTMKPSAHRTRLAWALAASSGRPEGELQREAIAEFVKARYETLHPERGPVSGVRFLRIVYETGEPALAHPSGHWERPPLDTVPPGKGLFLSTHTFGPR